MKANPCASGRGLWEVPAGQANCCANVPGRGFLMPATSHPSTHTPGRAPQLGSLLASDELAGFASASVLDSRPAVAVQEPLGEEVELRVADDFVRFMWGRPWELGTAAYWAEQTRRRAPDSNYALGANLTEEVAACMLGGYGMPAAVGLAAFDAVRDAGLLAGCPSPAAIEEVLRRPLEVRGRARPVGYRFARQRAGRLSAALAMLHVSDPPQESVALRDWLATLPGIGLKTASWVVRNYCGCDAVAIVDIHIQRAGLAAGFFAPHWRLPQDYRQFEEAFCRVASLAGVSAAALDACIWHQMQALGRARQLLLAR